MKGQTELPEFMLKLLATVLFTVILIGGILAISQFRVQVNESANTRLAIDFAENVLAASCLTEKKGLFNETMLNSEIKYSSSHTEDKDGISCLKTSALLLADVKTADGDWFFGSHLTNYKLLGFEYKIFEFPAALNSSDGNIVPAKVSIFDPNLYTKKYVCNNLNEGYNCYNCLEKEKCENGGCKWEAGECKP